MIVTVLSRDRLNTVALPANVTGAHWIDDADGTRLAFIEAADGIWHIEPHAPVHVRGRGGEQHSVIELEPTKRAVLSLEGEAGAAWSLMFYPDNPGSRQSQLYGFAGDMQFTVGRGQDNAIVYDTQFISEHHVRLTYQGGAWQAEDLDSTNGVFVNGYRIRPNEPVELSFGDVVSLLNLYIVVGSGLFSCNNPGGLVSISPDFVRYQAGRLKERDAVTHPDRELFYPSLRFARTIESKSFSVDAPPQPEPEDETSLAMRIGPSAVMALVSLLSLAIMPSVLTAGMAAAMLTGSVVWPIVNGRSQKSVERKGSSAPCGVFAISQPRAHEHFGRGGAAARDTAGESYFGPGMLESGIHERYEPYGSHVASCGLSAGAPRFGRGAPAGRHSLAGPAF